MLAMCQRRSSMSSRGRSDRIAALDALRALAILLVIVHHLRRLPGRPELFAWIGTRAFVGVDIFFVLSGWLIGGQLLRHRARTGRLGLGRFYARRWLRTLPAYYAALAILVVDGHLRADDLRSMLVFAQNYLAPLRWVISWSLCIEEHFYLALPPLLLALAWLWRRSHRLALALIAGLLLLSLLLRALAFPEMHAGSYRAFVGGFYMPTHLRLDGLAIGVATAALAHRGGAAWRWCTDHADRLAAAGALLLVGSAWNPYLTGASAASKIRMEWFTAVPLFWLVSLAVALMIPACVTPTSWLARRRWLGATLVAEHAYTLYLTNEWGRVWTRDHLGWVRAHGFWAEASACVLVSVIAALALRHLAEKPGLRARAWLLGRRSAPASGREVRPPAVPEAR